MRGRLELLGLAAAVLLIGTFLFSFFRGVGDRRPTEDPISAEPEETTVRDPPPVEGRVRVEVLNGSGRTGLARAATDALRGAGFDVVYFGNAAARADTSVVLARSTDDTGARAVASVLGIRDVRTEPDSTLLLEVTVVLGGDRN